MKSIKAYAVMTGDFLPDLRLGKIENIYHIHSFRKDADNFVKELKKEGETGFRVVPILITPIKE